LKSVIHSINTEEDDYNEINDKLSKRFQLKLLSGKKRRKLLKEKKITINTSTERNIKLKESNEESDGYNNCSLSTNNNIKNVYNYK